MSQTLNHYFFQKYLNPEDEIGAVFHRHFLVEVPNIFFWIVVPILGVSYGIYHFFFPEILSTPFLFLFEGYLFIMFLIMLHKILDWYCDVWIITKRGIYDVRWSLTMKDVIFMDFHEISGIKSSQKTIADKLFHIGDITLYKMGEELRIQRMYEPDAIVAAVETNLIAPVHKEEPKNDLNIYIDGVRQHNARYSTHPREHDDHFVASVKNKPGTIDLSGNDHPHE